MKTPDILNSKIKKIRIELPHYSFSHSSSGDSPHAFIGRERMRDKLKKVVEDSPDEPGVYLIAGNRGVGKTSYVNEVIKDTSLQPVTKFTENIKYLILLLLFVTGIQLIFHYFSEYTDKIWAIWPVFFGLSFIVLCCTNSYRHKLSERNIGLIIWDSIRSAVKELGCFINSYNPYGKTQYVLRIILVVSFTQILFKIFFIEPIKSFIGYTIIVFAYIFFKIGKNKLYEYRKKYKKKNKLIYILLYLLKYMLLYPIWNYIKNHNRLYLRINFGHKLKDEKDILRLITRTLSTEYSKYLRLFRRMLPQRIMTFGLLLLFAYLFSTVLEKSIFTIKNENKYLKDNISKVVINEDYNSELEIEHTRIEATIDTKIGNILHMFGNLFYEISKTTENVINNILGNNENLNINNNNKFLKIIFLRDYFFWFSFIMLFLLFKLLFNCNWITYFFVTHQIIMRRLNKLNNDITHSTERENSINVNNENFGTGIGTRTKKSRNIADAREIEKELQDILGEMQRIPMLMCRPNVVIVFDELDKVEPGDSNTEKEISQTKASLFSINATRDRQTEILRILSNMKYFLSTARAKFIFIAGREMFDIHLADVSERNNYIGSIFNAVILVPSFLTDHHTGKKTLPQESSIASLPEEFVCRRLFPHDYNVDIYNLKNYRIYLEKEVYKKINDKTQKEEIIQKIIAVLQQFIIYLAHVSKGAPKKMVQLFESFIEIHNERDINREDDFLIVQNYHNSRHFLSFNYYRQYTIGIIAYLITPIFYRLAESNIKEHSDKLLVSSLRFVDFLFKFHKHSFSWKILDISPEMLEVNRAPELKSVVVDLLNYLTQVHINKSNFNLSEYKFDSLIANEIFAMAKTEEVFSALFSFSLDEMLPLKKHYLDLLEKTKKAYKNKKKSPKFIDAISSLQSVLGDIYYYDDGLEEAEAYYKNTVQILRKNKNIKEMTFERFYVYVRNMLRLGIIYEKRKQYDFAYLTYGEICERIIYIQDITLNSQNNCNKSFLKLAYEGLKILYLPFIAKIQILELSHMGGIVSNHLEQLDKEFEQLKSYTKYEAAKFLETEFLSRVADIIYYKNSDLKNKDENNIEYKKINYNENLHKNCSCTACYYYYKALYTLLYNRDIKKSNKKIIIDILITIINQLKSNNNMKYCTILGRLLSDWGNVFFSCDSRCEKDKNDKCYICDANNCNTALEESSNVFLENCISYIESEKENVEPFCLKIGELKNKKDIAFAMYSISLNAYRKANLYKRTAYQIFKMSCLFKHYDIYKSEEFDKYIDRLSKIAIHYLWNANENLNVLELNKRKKDFKKITINKEDKIPLQNLLIDSEIIRIWVMNEKIKLKLVNKPEDLKRYYDIRITSPYKINYSIEERIYRIWLKSKVNYNAYQQLVKKLIINYSQDKEYVLEKNDFNKLFKSNECKETIRKIFGEQYDIIPIFENLIAETIYCLIDIAQLSETMGETFVFTNSFLGSIYAKLSFWIRLFESYEIYTKEINLYNKYGYKSHINDYLKKYLDEEWREQLTSYRENQLALSYYNKCLEMHKEGRAYHNRIDTMYYLRDDYNDRSDHFNIAEERHLIVNEKIEKKINAIKDNYKDSELYKVENYNLPKSCIP